VILARGEVVDTNNDLELLWALQGAGASIFGIITELRVKVYPIPKLDVGFVAFLFAEAALIIGRMEKLLGDGFPDEFSGDATAVKPRLVHGICPAHGGESAPGDRARVDDGP
jgi:FAD/FMN-containing dehydrogenase